MRVEEMLASALLLSLERLVGLENLSKLNRFPKVAEWVKGGPDGAILQFTETAPSGPMYGGRRVVSAYDSSAEAARRIALLPDGASDITCFGVGDGVLIRQLLERPGTKRESCPFGPASFVLTPIAF